MIANVDGRRNVPTDGRTNGRTTLSLYRVMPEAGATKRRQWENFPNFPKFVKCLALVVF